MIAKKTIFLSFLIGLMCAFQANAQKYSLGLKAGASVNWSGFGDKFQKDTFSTGVSSGYSAGFQIGFPLKNNYRFMAEGAFSRKGRAIKFNDKQWENRSVYHFAEATMLLRKTYKFNLEKNIPSEWFFNVGPEISYWINGKGAISASGPGYPYKVVFNKIDYNSGYDKMYLNNVNRWLFGLSLGAGFTAPLQRNQKISVELRFTSGHTFLGKRNSSTHINGYLTGDGNFQDTLKTNLKVISILVAYTFDFDVQQSRKGKSTLDKTIKKNR